MQITAERIAKVWSQAIVVPGYNPSFVRKDACGAWILRQHFGKRTPYGWNVDLILPSLKGGKDDDINIRPLHWKNILSKGDDYPNYIGAITSMDNANVCISKMWTINIKKQKELKTYYGK